VCDISAHTVRSYHKQGLWVGIPILNPVG